MAGKKKKPGSPEREFHLETAILDFLNSAPGCFAIKIETGGYYDKNIGAYRRRLSKYNIVGSPDIIGCYHGYYFCMEVKTALGRVSPHQRAFLDQVIRMGGIAGVVRSVEDAAALLGIQINHANI